MFNRSGRSRIGNGNTLAIGAALLAVSGGLCTAQGGSETTLMGITLLKSNYRDVLKKFGKPDEIQAGGPFVPVEGVPGGKAAQKGGPGGPGAPGSGGMMPGGPGAPGSGGMMPGAPGSSGTGSGKRVPSKNGFPSKSGGASGPSGSTFPGAPSSAGSTGPGLPGFAASIGAMLGPGAPNSGGMMPGAPGYPGSGGMPGMPGMPAGPGGQTADTEEPPEFQATWWYHDLKHGLHRSFLFNRDGRVIQVQEYGYDKFHLGGKTQRGVALGSNMGTVLKQYGWSNNGANNGKLVVLRYGGEEKVAFQLVNNNVVGITIAVVKDNPTEGPK